MAKQYVIMDKTANTGKDYLDEEMNNVWDEADAKHYESTEDAQKALERWEYHMERSADDWAIIVECQCLYYNKEEI